MKLSWLVPLIALLALAPAAGAAGHAALDASPTDHALVVLDVRLRQKSLMATTEGELRAGSLRTASFAGQPLGDEHSGKAVVGVVPFAVAPGRYRAASAKVEMPRLQAGTGKMLLSIPLPIDSLAALDCSVEAGALVYLGRVEVQSTPKPFQENAYRFTIVYDRFREREVWRKLLEKKAGPWEEAIRSRLSALSDSAAAANAAAAPSPAPADTAR